MLRLRAKAPWKKGTGTAQIEPSYREYRAPRARVSECHSQGGRRSGFKPSLYGKKVTEAHSKNNRIVSTARRARVCRHVTPRAGKAPGLKQFRKPICYVIKGDVRDVNEQVRIMFFHQCTRILPMARGDFFCVLRVKWPFSIGTCQKHMVFMVLGRFETSQGLRCNLSGVPGTYEKHMVFTALGRRGPSRGVLLALFAAPGSFLAGYALFSCIFGRFSWGPGRPKFLVFTILGRCEGSQWLP